MLKSLPHVLPLATFKSPHFALFTLLYTYLALYVPYFNLTHPISPCLITRCFRQRTSLRPNLHYHLTFLSSLYLTFSTQVTFVYLISLDLTLTHFFRRIEYCFIRPYLFQPMSLHLTPLLSPWLYFTVACPVSSPNLPHLCLTLHHFPSSRFNLFTLIHSCYLILSHFTPTPSSSP